MYMLLYLGLPQAPPASTVKVLIQASSYLGADVSGAVIDLSWTVPKATGKLNVTTDAQGKAEVRRSDKQW